MIAGRYSPAIAPLQSHVIESVLSESFECVRWCVRQVNEWEELSSQEKSAREELGDVGLEAAKCGDLDKLKVIALSDSVCVLDANER